MKRAVYILCLLLLTNVIDAQQNVIYDADSNRQIHNLAPYTYVLVDSLLKFSDQEVLTGKADQHFSPYFISNFKGLVAPQYWLQIRVKGKSEFNNWFLLFKDSVSRGETSANDYVNVYYLDTAGHFLRKEVTGVFVPRSQKRGNFTPGFNAVLMSLKEGEELVIMAKVINSSLDPSPISFVILQDPTIPKSNNSFGNTFPTLSGIAIVFCILSLFFFFFIREKSYLLFCFYTLVLSQHYLILHPDKPFIDIFIPEHPHLVLLVWDLITMGGFILFCLFGRYFIDLPKLSKRTDKYFKLYLYIWAIAMVADMVLTYGFKSFLLPQLSLTLFAGLGMLAFFIRFALFKSMLAKLFVGGALWLFVFTVMGVLWGNKVISLPFNPWPVAQVGQMLIYAAALAYKVRLNEKARAEASRIKDMDEIKSRFFANISHEFRTPLTLIQGPLQQIEEQSNGSKEAVPVPMRHIKTMRRNTDRLLELVNQLLDLTKLDSGKMRLQVVKGDILQLLKAITASYESVAERKNIHYHVHFPEQSLISFFDKDKLEKIFSNLLSNAFKYTGEGGRVSVDVEIEGNRLRMSVEDNGPGIPKKELDKIFDRFYQLEGTEDKGSGIGLALVKELVTLYRGQISVSSDPGKGSRFRVTLPVDKDLFKEEELVYGQYVAEETYINRPSDATELKELLNPVSLQLPLMLLVEDNKDLRAFIKETVSNHYQVIEAINGKEGVERAIEEVPDIIVSDVMMPVMDGFTLAEKLKKDETTSHIPIILLTAKAGQTHKVAGLNKGADDYLTKPFDAPELLARMENLVKQRKLLRKKFAGEIILKPSEVSVSSAEDQFLQKLMNAIEKNLGEDDFGVEELAKEVAMSRSQLHRKLVALTGKSPSEVLRNTRLLRAKELLQKKTATPSEVAFKVGFNSHAYFSKCFKEEFGISPSEVG